MFLSVACVADPSRGALALAEVYILPYLVLCWDSRRMWLMNLIEVYSPNTQCWDRADI